MTPKQFAEARRRRGLSQAEYGAALGISEGMVALYEAGRTRDKPPRPVVVPLHIELATAALAVGITGFDGEKITAHPPDAPPLSGRGSGRSQR